MGAVAEPGLSFAGLLRQLRGEAGPNQVLSPSVAMTQSIGGSGATAVTHILKRTA